MNNIILEEAQKIIEREEATVVDVRTPAEFEEGHIPGAINFDFYNETFKEKIRSLDTNGSYIINCQSGGRSAKATAILQELGFKNVKNLLGGITAWKTALLPVEKSK